MRPALIGSLMIVGLLAIGLRAQSQQASDSPRANPRVQKSRPVKPAEAPAPPRDAEAEVPDRPEAMNPVSIPEPKSNGKPSWVITSTLQVTARDAEESALEEARQTVDAYLRSQHPPVEWTVTPDYVNERLVKQRKTEQLKDKEFPVAEMNRTTLTVSITEEDRKDIVKKDQEFRMQGRMLVLAKLLGALVVLLAAVAGYVYLDERTKGYYTSWLIVGVLASLVVAGVWALLV
jgi:hypothetical protein